MDYIYSLFKIFVMLQKTELELENEIDENIIQGLIKKKQRIIDLLKDEEKALFDKGIGIIIDNNACNNCNLTVPSQIIINVKKYDSFQFCPACGSLLIIV